MKTFVRMLAWALLSCACAALHAKDLLVTQLVPLSGPVGGPGSMFAAGASMYFDHVNSTGGINGQRIRHQVIDDKYDVDTSLASLNTALSGTETPLALLTFGTASTHAVAAELDKRKLHLPVFPTGTGSASLRQPFDRNLFHVRASYSAEFAKMIDILATTGVSGFAVVYQDDEFGRNCLAAAVAKLAELKQPTPLVFKHDRKQQDIAGLAPRVAAGNVRAVLLATTPAATASFVRQLRGQTGNILIASTSDLDPVGLFKDVGLAAKGVVLSQSLPDPTSRKRPMVSDFLRLVDRSGGKVQPNAYALEGYIQARVLVEGLRRSNGASPTALMDALESIKALDLGGYTITFGERSHEGGSFVDTAIIADEGHVVR